MFQDSELSEFNSYRVIEYAALWRFYFVSKHEDISQNFFFLSQIIRGLYAMFYSQDPKLKLLNNLIKLNWKIARAASTGRNPEELLKELSH